MLLGLRICSLFVALLLLGCAKSPSSEPAANEEAAISPSTEASATPDAAGPASADPTDGEVRAAVERFRPDTSMGLIYISKRTMTLTLYDADMRQVMRVPMACGRNRGHKQKRGDNRTPEGSFTVQQVQPADTWGHDFNDGKGFIPHAYGPWFIRLKTGFNGIGIHGTHDPASIGTRATEGCIRLLNDDLARLKPHVQLGMAVIVGEETAADATSTPDSKQ